MWRRGLVTLNVEAPDRADRMSRKRLGDPVTCHAGRLCPLTCANDLSAVSRSCRLMGLEVPEKSPRVPTADECPFGPACHCELDRALLRTRVLAP